MLTFKTGLQSISLIALGLICSLPALRMESDTSNTVGDIIRVSFSILSLTGLIGGTSLLFFETIPSKTEVQYSAQAKTFVYDTYEKKFILIKNIFIDPMAFKYDGLYKHKKTNQSEVQNIYASLLHNELIKNYNSIYDFLLEYVEKN